MFEWLELQGIYLLRIIVAAMCGAAIGYERQNKLKTAGIRTHIIVSIASSLMMIISKYGFFDVINIEGMEVDPSRIAAGVFTAIGFLGAGIIFVHNQTVSGLTTAAGIWATVGIGMAVGSGMYLVGIITGILVIISQLILHRHPNNLKNPIIEKIVLHVSSDENKFNDYIEILEKMKIKIVNMHMSRLKDEIIEVKLYVRFPETYNIKDVLKIFMNDSSIKSIEI